MHTANEENLIAKANRMGKVAVGKQFTIKLSDSGRANKVTVSGTIVECGFGYFHNTLTRSLMMKQQAIFKVVLEVGPNKILREFHVQKVPQ